MVVSIFGDKARVLDANQAGAKGYLLKTDGLAENGTDILNMLQRGSPINPPIARHLWAMVQDNAAISP